MPLDVADFERHCLNVLLEIIHRVLLELSELDVLDVLARVARRCFWLRLKGGHGVGDFREFLAKCIQVFFEGHDLSFD